MRKPIFYSGTKNASSWAMRAWLALRAADYEFEEKVVDIRRPQRFENLRAIQRISAPGCVPVLDTGTTVIADSIAIMEFANEVAGGKLLPHDVERRARARAIVAWQHSGLSGICSRISFESAFYPVKRALGETEIAESRRLFEALEPELVSSGGPFLFGKVGLPDLMLTPTVVRLARHETAVREWPLVSRWFDAVMNHRLVSEWLDEADRLYHIWDDGYLLPGVALDAAAR